MTQRPDHDPAPDATLDGLVRGYRHLAGGEPPANLDAAVRARALQRTRQRRARAWTVPAALAATVLLAFTVILNLQQEPAESTTPATARPTALDAAAPRTPEVASRELAAPAAPPAAGQLMKSAPAELQETPEAWFARIEALEARGLQVEAAAERERLEAAYPGWLAEHAPGRD